MLGNEEPEASVVGEIVPAKEFYDYEAKYLSDGSIPIIPGEVSEGAVEGIPRDGDRGVSRLRLCRARAGRLPA